MIIETIPDRVVARMHLREHTDFLSDTQTGRPDGEPQTFVCRVGAARLVADWLDELQVENIQLRAERDMYRDAMGVRAQQLAESTDTCVLAALVNAALAATEIPRKHQSARMSALTHAAQTANAHFRDRLTAVKERDV